MNVILRLLPASSPASSVLPQYSLSYSALLPSCAPPPALHLDSLLSGLAPSPQFDTAILNPKIGGECTYTYIPNFEIERFSVFVREMEQKPRLKREQRGSNGGAAREHKRAARGEHERSTEGEQIERKQSLSAHASQKR